MEKQFDVAVIGGGVIGGTILRELTKYNVKACLLEKGADICRGQSRANSGIVHAGFDALEGSLKAKFNVLGCKMMEEYAKELGVKYVNNGSLVVAYNEQDLQTLKNLKARGEANGVERLEIINRDRLRELEPNIVDQAIGALYAPTAGIVCPYGLTIASIGNAMDNGAQLFTDFEVTDIVQQGGLWQITSSCGQSVSATLIINCAGLGAGAIATLLGDVELATHPRKGEYILLDRESGDFVNHTIFTTPSEKGKGILVTQTVDKNILLGPTSVEKIDEEIKDTTKEGLDYIIESVNKMCKGVPLYNAITSFTGVRAYCDRHDFVIEFSNMAKNAIHCLGIESPGLTASPAIAKYVVEELVAKVITLTKNTAFNGKRLPDDFFKHLSIQEKNEIIKKEPAYGKIVCRCEQVTEGEILRAIRENPKAKTVDGVKMRTRSGMGRCQGGFCQTHVVELIAKEYGLKLEEVTKKGNGSYLVTGVTK